jgi:hypothetical protein
LGGKTANEKLAGDIIELVKLCLSGNYKSAIENTKGKLESCEIEQNKHAENVQIHDCNIQKLFKDLDKYRKETKATGKKQSISKGPLATTSECESSLCEANAKANAKVNNANLCAENNSLASKSYSNDNTLSQKSSNQLQKSQAEPHCADKNENSNISETAKNQASTNGSESDFIGVEKHRTKQLYLGGVHEGVNEQLIVNYMEKKGISPTFVRLFKSKRKGTVAVRVNVKLSDFETVSVNDFWPKHVYAREWISKQKWLKKNKTDDD